MLIPTFAIIVPPALGLDALPVATLAVQLLGLAGLLVVAGFPLLLSRLVGQPDALGHTRAAARLAAAAKTLAEADASAEGWADGLDRRVSVLCTATFAVMGALCGGLALASWLAQGPGAALGLGAAAVAFLFAALATGSETLRR